MVRLFSTPDFSLLPHLVALTPWPSVKVTIRTNGERIVEKIDPWQRLAALGACILFWKTWLPLSIGLAVWYHLSNTHNERTQDQIEQVRSNRNWLGRLDLTEEAKAHLAQDTEIPYELRATHLPVPNQDLSQNEDLREIFSQLPKEKQLDIAIKNQQNLLWALEIDASFAPKLPFNLFEVSDAVAAAAYELLPLDELPRLTEGAKGSLQELLIEPESALARSVAATEAAERLQALARPELLKDIVRVLPEDKRHLLEDSAELQAAISDIDGELKQLDLSELAARLEEEPIILTEDQGPFVTDLYRRCSQAALANLIISIHKKPNLLNELRFLEGLDLSFVEDAWFHTIFPQLDQRLREAITFTLANCRYTNLSKVLNLAPLDSWRSFAKVHVRIQTPQTPRSLIRACVSSIGPQNNYLIQELSKEQFQVIFGEYKGDIYALIAVVTNQVDKVGYLIEQHFDSLDLSRLVQLLISKGIGENALEIAKGLSDARSQAFLQSFHHKFPLPGFAKTPKRAPNPIDKTSTTAEIKDRVQDRLKNKSLEEKVTLYRQLMTPGQASQAIEELAHKNPGVGRQVLAFAAAALTEGAFEAVSGIHPSSGSSSSGRIAHKLMLNGHESISAEAIVRLLLDAASMQEMQAFCRISPRPVLKYFAAKENDDERWTNLLTSEIFRQLSSSDWQEITSLCLVKSKFTAVAALVKLAIEVNGNRPLDTATLEFMITHCGKATAITAFEAFPEDALKIGGASLAQKVRNTDTWKALDASIWLSALPIETLLQPTLEKEPLQKILATSPDNLPAGLVDALKTTEHLKWATEVLTDEAVEELLIIKISPKDVIENWLFKSDTSKAHPDTAFQNEVIEAFAHKISPEKISINLLYHRPIRATSALNNPHLSREQRNAWISIGAADKHVVRKIVRESREELACYIQNAKDLQHLWFAAEKLYAEGDILRQINARDYKTFPMPRGKDEWRVALEVDGFKNHLADLIYRSEKMYKEEIQNLPQGTQWKITDLLKDQGFWGKYYAKELGPIAPPQEAEKANASALSALSFASSFWSSMASSPSSISNREETPMELTPAANGSITIATPMKPATPLAYTPYLGLSSPRTAARQSRRLPRTSPLSRLTTTRRIGPSRLRNGAGPIPAMAPIKPQAEELAELVINGISALTQVLAQDPNFLKQLPVFEEGGRYLLGELCLKGSVDDVKTIIAAQPEEKHNIALFLGKPEFNLQPNDPKLGLLY